MLNSVCVHEAVTCFSYPVLLCIYNVSLLFYTWICTGCWGTILVTPSCFYLTQCGSKTRHLLASRYRYM